MRNNYTISNGEVIIELNRADGSVAFTRVSENKLKRLLQLDVKWCLLDQNTRTCYVTANLWDSALHKNKTIRLHRVLTNAPDGLVVNHISGDGLDNTDSNLEVVTNQVNTVRRAHLNLNNTSGIRGVSYSSKRRKWEVKFRKDYKTYHFGRYARKEDAEQVARTKYIELFAEMAVAE